MVSPSGPLGERGLVRKHYSIGHEEYDGPRLVDERGRVLSEHDVELFSELYAAADLPSNHRALEVAAGTGRFTVAGLAHAGQIIATDINESLLAGLRERAPVDDGRIDVRIEDAFSLSFTDNEFDAVYAMHFIPRLRTVSDQAAAITEMARVLRPGGRLIINFRNRGSLLYGRTYKRHAIRPDEMNSMLRNAGLAPLDWRGKHVLTRRLLDLTPKFAIRVLRKMDWALRASWPDRAWDVFVLAEKPASP